jgi:hypothetical protein
MSSPGRAELSVVLPTDTWETIRPVVERLERQSIAERIELVLVVPPGAAAGVARLQRGRLGALVVVEVEAILPLARARAAGVRAARAPLVFVGETHSYPRAGWAEAIVTAAARDQFAVFVSGFGNANPNGVLSWSGFLLDYGCWQHGHTGGPVDTLPIFNSVYRTAVLHALGDRLEHALGHGDALVVALRASGQRALLAPDARLDHVNVAQPRAWVQERVATGRLLGANRSVAWSWPRRLAYAGACPLIALVLALRALRGVRRHGGTPRAPRGTLLAMLAAASLKAFGEAQGYLGGASRRVEDAADEFELHKLAYSGRAGR